MTIDFEILMKWKGSKRLVTFISYLSFQVNFTWPSMLVMVITPVANRSFFILACTYFWCNNRNSYLPVTNEILIYTSHLHSKEIHINSVPFVPFIFHILRRCFIQRALPQPVFGFRSGYVTEWFIASSMIGSERFIYTHVSLWLSRRNIRCDPLTKRWYHRFCVILDVIQLIYHHPAYH